MAVSIEARVRTPRLKSLRVTARARRGLRVVGMVMRRGRGRAFVSARPSHLEFKVVASNDHVHERDHGHDGYGQEANPA